MYTNIRQKVYLKKGGIIPKYSTGNTIGLTGTVNGVQVKWNGNNWINILTGQIVHGELDTATPVNNSSSPWEVQPQLNFAYLSPQGQGISAGKLNMSVSGPNILNAMSGLSTIQNLFQLLLDRVTNTILSMDPKMREHYNRITKSGSTSSFDDRVAQAQLLMDIDDDEEEDDLSKLALNSNSAMSKAFAADLNEVNKQSGIPGSGIAEDLSLSNGPSEIELEGRNAKANADWEKAKITSIALSQFLSTGNKFGDFATGLADVAKNGLKDAVTGGLSGGAGAMLAGAGKIATAGIDMVDNALMGDKNFGALSAAIDKAADMAADAAMNIGSKFGPMGAAIGAAAGVGIKAANFLTKAGGLTVEGFDVNVDSSGYGDIGHMESKSNRDFGMLFGLGGLNGNKIQRQLQKRNEQAQMALAAANIAAESKYELEARTASIHNTVRNNQIALAGGLESDLIIE